ncbi:heterokaryon incompatibility protein-domain-containing protein [Cercophora newfieldiana]|uniref:Heterokaryon incompatibility protein-domain-containing protein n=1 Tax=Cercophora newfieldiana TaxID=92897 RepID=A0AA39XZH0_9PEZI|nr:heterokaryon incompatibility protein-domain-containing protein [Cercophora newfieldiana]
MATNRRSYIVNPDECPPFVYSPLDTSRDCTRLVAIEPSQNVTSPLRCRLTHVNFSDRPRYQALSYMWGDESIKRPIFVDGKSFYVGKNLFDALHFLRHRKSGRFFWVDALCINQSDIQEKNRQIRIMPHIYFRATKVLIWLGTKETLRRHSEQSASLYTKYAEEQSMQLDAIKQLARDEYWQRLWVIQEIGKAAELQVCYQTRLLGEHPMYQDHGIKWERFISSVKNCGDFSAEDKLGPLRLDAQLRGKYHGSHSLRSLLEAHHGALCRNPRDKVYGLAGLADDCYGFPVDYDKSLFEVWSDTLTFLQDIGQIQEDLPGLALLMMNALGGAAAISPSPGLTSDVELWLPLTFVGTVAHVGPTPMECINSLAEADNWTVQMRRFGRMGCDMEANEKLFRRLLQAENPDSPCLSVFPIAGVPLDVTYRMKDDTEATLELLAQDFDETPASSSSKNDSRLYQMLPVGWKTTGCSLGVARGNLRALDLICRVPQTGNMIVLRRDELSRAYSTGPDGQVMPVKSFCYRIVGAVSIVADRYLPCGSWEPPAMDSKDPLVSLY